jgi:hypothetical protein
MIKSFIGSCIQSISCLLKTHVDIYLCFSFFSGLSYPIPCCVSQLYHQCHWPTLALFIHHLNFCLQVPGARGLAQRLACGRTWVPSSVLQHPASGHTLSNLFFTLHRMCKIELVIIFHC